MTTTDDHYDSTTVQKTPKIAPGVRPKIFGQFLEGYPSVGAQNPMKNFFFNCSTGTTFSQSGKMLLYLFIIFIQYQR